MIEVDRLIIGGGLYGLYSALYCGRKGMKVQVLEMDAAPFERATYINQARVHMGYHYPRSLTTAVKSAGYFRRFNDDFGFSVHSKFDQVYATSDQFSWTDAKQFMEFCKAANIRCDEVPASKYFKDGMCDGAFLTEEYTYDAHVLREYLLAEIANYPNIHLKYGVRIDEIVKDGSEYVVRVHVSDGDLRMNTDARAREDIKLLHDLCFNGDSFEYRSGFVLNATYASVNQILSKIYPDDIFKIKYELCEIILCEPSDRLKNVGITVMDGPFFSIMPFGLTGMHSLTSVTFTPHVVSFDECPTFKCQEELEKLNSTQADTKRIGVASFSCDAHALNNCNLCPARPKSAWPYMSHLADKYLKEEYGYKYVKSLYSMKPILKSSEVDDSRPTAIKVHSGNVAGEPTFISVLSGKINTVYDLDKYLN